VKVVQRIMVKLEIEDAESKPPLLAGMSTQVEVDTEANRLERMFDFSAQAKE
jgi:multidrug resistance efflux pump